jgi:pyruvate formate lyase activating enzyme
MALKEALLYEKLEDNKVSCFLCSHRCVISDGKVGICNVRENRGGTLYTHTYGKLISEHVDPIEKKPLYHFLPGSTSFSIATIGCNFQCGFCQNWQISQVKEATKLGLDPQEVKPEMVMRQAKRSGCASISYTYTEPTIFFEYAHDIAKLAKEAGLSNVFVTNGFMTKEMIHMVRPYLDAANVDLKSFSDDFYRKVCKGKLEPVLENIELMKRLNIWIEVTTLVVPGLNDSEDELNKIATFLVGIDKAIPWHISRFYPQYEMDRLENTPLKVLDRAYQIGKQAGLRYVYLGNVGAGNSTFCHHCNKLLIERLGFSISGYHLKNGHCPDCNSPIDGVGL